MKKIKYNIRFFIDKNNNQVMCRVYWNHNLSHIELETGVFAQVEQWDQDKQRVKWKSVHIIGGKQISGAVINNRIEKTKRAIDFCFSFFTLQNIIPTTSELKNMIDDRPRGRIKDIIERNKISSPLKELLDRFLFICGRQKNWNDIAKEKYTQAFMHLTSADPNVSVDSISLDTMYKLRDWYIQKGYRNRTVNRQITMLKSFLKWINQQDGYTIPANVLNFQPNLKVLGRTVTFLNYDELIAFSKYKFHNKRLDKARDQWCFMAFTSLRYSDLAALHVTDIVNGEKISLFTEKTDELITVPLIDEAKAILKKYNKRRTKDGLVFDVLSNQKLNDYIKEAAKEAGLDRVIVDTYYIGTKRLRETHRFYEIISCHAARRTFVSCSLAMGIPPEVVMKATGHRDYKTMKPYIATSDETQAREMSKWNQQQYRSQILTLLDRANDAELKEILASCRGIVK